LLFAWLKLLVVVSLFICEKRLSQLPFCSFHEVVMSVRQPSS